MSENDAWGLDGRGRAWVRWAWTVFLVLAVAVVLAIAWALAQLTQLQPPRGLEAQPAVSAAPPVEAPAPVAQPPAGTTVSADPDWTARTASATGIPPRALQAYATAALIVGAEQPACGIGWNTLAGIGAIESGHGSHGGSVLQDSGYPEPPILGIPLDGTRSMAIADTDGGRWDGDTVWDRAVGPMQFIPETWERWGADVSGDGAADPNQIDDAALAAGRYLCDSGEMTSVDGWRRAIFRYNNLESYVNDVAATADVYATRAG